MEIKPVKLKRKPGYPTIKTFIENPELLSKNVPFAWIRNQYAATTLATFILCGCGNLSNRQKEKPTIVVVSKDVKKDKSAAIKSVKNDPIKVARIFSHGDGTGAIGCEVMSPPVFISEDEARKIIFTALKKENLIFSTTNTPVLKFAAPPIANDCIFNKQIKNEKKAKVEIQLDGYNKQYNLAIEYVSADDFKKFKNDDSCMSSVEGFNTKGAAELIMNELKNQGTTNAVVFYDPMPRISFMSTEMYGDPEIRINNLARVQLLAQVKDFIDWIKKEGIIKN
jgi:hypothetical protein